MVSVVLCTMREDFLTRAVKQFLQQTVPEKELIIVLNHNKMQLENWQSRLQSFNDIRVFQMDEAKTLGECLNFGASQARHSILAKMDDDDYYSPDYLSRSIQQLKDNQADVTGKAGIFVYFQNDKLLALFRPQLQRRLLKSPHFFLAGGTLVFKKKVWETVPFQELSEGEDVQFQRDCLSNRYVVYSGDSYEYALIRYGKCHNHSWQAWDDAFQKQCKRIAVTDLYEKCVREGGGL
ncbi:glycosyltransferase [Neobacillus sp. Marseille-QA0830]